MSESKFSVCPKCWQLYETFEIHTWGESKCRKCGQANCVEVATPNIPAPTAGAQMLCLVCAAYKPWGIFDTATGVTVCVECRDKARKPNPKQMTPTPEDVRCIEWIDANCKYLGLQPYSELFGYITGESPLQR
jgi:hypothetical protein